MSKLIVAVVKSIMNINKKNCIAQGPAQILNDLMHPHLPPLPIKQLITRGVCHNTPIPQWYFTCTGHMTWAYQVCWSNPEGFG